MGDDIRGTSFDVTTGNVTRDEYVEAAKAAGLFRRGRAVAALGTVFLAAASVSPSPDGFTVHPLPLGLAVAYALVTLLVLPRWAVARGFRTGRAAEEKRAVVDGTGIEVLRGGEAQRIGWDDMRWYHETPRLHVFVGRAGRRACLVVLPKRLFTAPGESDRLAALAHAQAGDGHCQGVTPATGA
ncbi:YcxB family protein [Streptomyces sp. NRRL S-87]|uniref:YcxB family protein n=1 Tax=Streptomyces sp. NRRL S-87 TaxID=1463920 RepID=UPI0004C24C25|nr:YcxB family protein [Streptomyces sp. NRRL S-87]